MIIQIKATERNVPAVLFIILRYGFLFFQSIGGRDYSKRSFGQYMYFVTFLAVDSMAVLTTTMNCIRGTRTQPLVSVGCSVH